jgi:DNA polymerase III alpha subunit (gram-positive type)
MATIDNPKYFLFDTETGGIRKEMSLLTLYGHILDDNLNILDTIDLKIKPDDGVYHVNAQGLEINRINIVEHDRIAKPLSEVKTRFKNYICGWSLNQKLTPVGHNVRFDVKFVKTHLLEDWDRYFDRRHIDTASVGKFLALSGIVPKLKTYSLSEMAQALMIEVNEDSRHEAKFDADLTLNVLRNMTQLIKGRNK